LRRGNTAQHCHLEHDVRYRPVQRHAVFALPRRIAELRRRRIHPVQHAAECVRVLRVQRRVERAPEYRQSHRRGPGQGSDLQRLSVLRRGVVRLGGPHGVLDHRLQVRRQVTLAGLLAFCAVYALAVATPGPGIAAIIARSLAHGFRGAPAFVAGFLIGDLVWFGIAATGLAALARTAATVFIAIKWAGVAYLLYLAWKLWTAPAERVAVAA